MKRPDCQSSSNIGLARGQDATFQFCGGITGERDRAQSPFVVCCQQSNGALRKYAGFP